MLCGAAATRAAGTASSGRLRTAVRLLAVAYAVLGTAYAFHFVLGELSPTRPLGRVLPPYAAAAAGAWLWTLAPRQRRRDDQVGDRASRAA